MPFVSQAQRGYFYAELPGLAKKWEEHTPKGKKLPKRVKKALPFDIDFKLANTAVAPNVGPASNQLAGFGQSMLGSVSTAIPKSTMFAPRPTPEIAPILGGPTGGPGTPMSGGAMPALPNLGTLKSMGRTNAAPASDASSSGTTTTAKSADWGSVLSKGTTAATTALNKVVPSLVKAAPKAEAAAARTALPNVMPKVTAQGSMSSGPSVAYPTPKAYSTPAAPPPAAKVTTPAPTAAATPTPAPATPVPASPTPAATSPSTLGAAKNFLTSPLNPSAAPPDVTKTLGKAQAAAQPYTNAATRLLTPHTTTAELGGVAEKALTGRTADPMRYTPGRSWGEWGKQNFTNVNPMDKSNPLRPTVAGTVNAGVQLATAPGRLMEGPLRTMMGGNRLGRGLGMPFALAGAGGYAAAAKLQNPDQPMADTGLSMVGRPISNMTNTLGITDTKDQKPAAGFGGVFDPLGVGGHAAKSIVADPARYGEILGKGTVDAGISGAQSIAKMVPHATDDNKSTIDQTLESKKFFPNPGRMPQPQAQAGTTPPVNASGTPAPGAAAIPGLTGSATTSGTNPQQSFPESNDPIQGAASSGNNFTTLQKGLSDIDQQIADAQAGGDDVTASALNAKKQQMQGEMDKYKQDMVVHGDAIAQKAAQDPALQMQGAQNLAKELPEGTPTSFISSMWQMLSSGKFGSFAPGLMIAGLGLGVLSMMGVFGNGSGLAGLAGLASSLVGAGMMGKDVWGQISSKLFGGGAAAPKPPAPPAAPPAAGVAAPKQAPAQNAPAQQQPAAPQQQAAPRQPLPAATPDNPIPMHPEEQQQLMQSPVLSGFVANGKLNPAAVEHFVKNGDPKQVPAIVNAIPPRLRPLLRAELDKDWRVSFTRVGSALLAQLPRS